MRSTTARRSRRRRWSRPGLADKRFWEGVKVLGNGELKKKLTVKAQRFSASAREKITKAGGQCEELPLRSIHHQPAEPAAAAKTPQERSNGRSLTTYVLRLSQLLENSRTAASRILFTLGMVAIARLGANIPCPGSRSHRAERVHGAGPAERAAAASSAWRRC